MKKVLIITYYWPPAGGPGVQRWLKFSKFLPGYDIEPFVLTVDPESATYPIIDQSLLREVPATVKVFTTATSEFFGTYKKATQRKGVPYSGFASEGDKPGLKEKAARFVRGNFFYPDPRKGWKKFALEKAREIISREDIDVIITTGPPHSTHLIGLELKRLTDVKWIADFRDPWTDIYYYRDFYPMAIVRHMEKKMEARVLEQADAITTASPGFGQLLGLKVEDAKKIFPITNGYDEDDLPTNAAAADSELIQITYTGTLTQKYPLKTLTKALASLDSDVKARLILNVVGKVDSHSEALLTRSDLGVRVNMPGYVSHDKVMDYLAQSRFLLLLIPTLKGNEGIIPAKLFEYIGVGRKIIAIGSRPSDAADIIEKNDFGRYFEPGDVASLKSWLEAEISSSEKLSGPSDEKRSLFSRSHLAGRMSEVIKSLS